MFWRKKQQQPERPSITWHVPEGTEDFLIPVRGSEGALAYDIICPTTEVVAAGKKTIINTLLAVTIPHDYGLIIQERSGFAFKHGIITGAGWIDEDYRGLIKICLFNLSDQDYTISAGDRFVQARLVKKYDAETSVSYEYPDPDETARGVGGFGSTGK